MAAMIEMETAETTELANGMKEAETTRAATAAMIEMETVETTVLRPIAPLACNARLCQQHQW